MVTLKGIIVETSYLQSFPLLNFCFATERIAFYLFIVDVLLLLGGSVLQFWQSKHPKALYPTEFSGKRNLRFVKCKDFLKFLLQVGATNHVHLIWNQGTSLFCSLTVTEQMTVCFQDCWSIGEHKCTHSWLHEHSRVKKQRKTIVLHSPPKSFVCTFLVCATSTLPVQNTWI